MSGLTGGFLELQGSTDMHEPPGTAKKDSKVAFEKRASTWGVTPIFSILPCLPGSPPANRSHQGPLQSPMLIRHG